MENHNYMLIADDAGEFRDTCKAALEAKGFEVEVCRKDGRALLDMIREKKPTAVLMEALMSGLDGLGVLMAVSRGECGVQPTIFTMTGMDAPGITNQLIRAGSAYHFVKPFDPDIIAERVEMMCAPAAGEEAVAAARPAVEVVDLETIVTEIIMEIGIPAHIKGYQYIRDGIIMTGTGDHQRRYQGALSGHRQKERYHRLPCGACHPPCHRGGLGPRGCGYSQFLFRLYHPQSARQAHQ